MRTIVGLAAALLLLCGGVAGMGAEETWRGTITDSMCGVKHSADKHGGKAADHRACVEKCIDRGGEYVLVTDGKAMKIANQSFDGLAKHAAQEVLLTGEIKDGAIVVSKIETPKSEKK